MNKYKEITEAINRLIKQGILSDQEAKQLSIKLNEVLDEYFINKDSKSKEG